MRLGVGQSAKQFLHQSSLCPLEMANNLHHFIMFFLKSDSSWLLARTGSWSTWPNSRGGVWERERVKKTHLVWQCVRDFVRGGEVESSWCTAEMAHWRRCHSVVWALGQLEIIHRALVVFICLHFNVFFSLAIWFSFCCMGWHAGLTKIFTVSIATGLLSSFSFLSVFELRYKY